MQYRELFQHSSDWLWEINAQNSYIYSNEGVSELLGFTHNEIIGKTPFDFMSEADAKKVKALFTLHASNKETTFKFEAIFIHQNGDEINLKTNLIAVLDEAQNIVGFEGLSSQNSKKETAILKERLELALRGSNDGVWDWNILDNSVYFDARWKEMLGYRDDELINEVPTWTNRIHPDDLEEVWTTVNKHVNSDTEYYEGIHRLKHKDGHWVWILDRGKALYNSDGVATRMIGTHTDISEQKALQLKTVHQNQIIEQIHDSVISTDLDGIITSWNNGSETLLGYGADEIIGKHISLIYPKEDFEALDKNIDNLMQNGESYSTVRLLTKSTGKLIVDLSLSLLKDEQGNVIGMVGYAKDITEKQKAEDALAQQSRMVQMGEMINMIAHQWRQPLNAISLTASGLKMKFDFEEFDSNTKDGFHQCSLEFSKKLDNIQEYVQNLSATVDDFRNFYKTDKVSVSMKLEDIVTKSLKIIGVSLKEDNIKLIEEYNSDAEIKLYANEIMQVILTIFKNAQDNFVEKKTKEPSIKIVTQGKTLSICDNGGGIPEDIMDKIFDPYFSTKLEKNGTGLGLYMAKTIIEEHHKAILTAKNIDGGACLTITFL